MVATARAAVCLCLWLAVSQVKGSYVSVEMNRTIQNLLQHYSIKPKDRFDGNPVFTRELLSGKMETKMLFMGGVLDTYEKLFSHMLKQLPTPSPQTAASDETPGPAVAPAVTPAAAGTASDAAAGAGGDVRVQLRYILKKVQELKKRRYQEQEKFLQGLHALKHIQMDNLIVQSKALWELPLLYEEASSLPGDIQRMQRRRRRRQVLRIKTHPRA